MRRLNMDIYLKHLKARYVRSDRKGKSMILDEFCATSGFHRKHAIRLFTRTVMGWREKPAGRKKHYEPALLLVREQLVTMSARTIDRLTKPLRQGYPRRMCGTKPGSLLKNQIAIKTNQWNESAPGFVEADTVAHCGTSLLGSFVWSITLTDIYSGWTENAAVWNKGAHGVLTQLRLIEERLPFTLQGFDCDNGSEFLNYHLLEYFQERAKPIQFTRSRPYHKGDNAHVEQKNWTHVRQLFGYYRYENPRLVTLMNDLYQNELSLLHNYFYPAMKLQDKVRIKSKIKKRYDQPQTPYQRLMNCSAISDEQKNKMRQVFDTWNPFDLQKRIQQKLKNISALIDIKLKGRTGT